MPAIIDEETFAAAQERFATNRRSKTRSPRAVEAEPNDTVRYWLTGKLFCGKCGHSMQGTHGIGKSGKRYDYYGCGEHLKGRGCSKTNVGKARIEIAIKSVLSTLLDDEELRASFAVDAAAYYRKTYGDDSYRRSLEAELKDVRLSLGNIIKAVEAGALSEALMERLRELEERKQALTEAIDAEKAKAELMADEYAIGTMFERYAHANLDDPQVRDDVLTYFIDKIYVFDDDLVITGDFVDYVGHDRYNREHYWSFNGFDTDFSSSKVFDLTELSSTIRNKGECQSGARPFFM